jgi:hypothetical protein
VSAQTDRNRCEFAKASVKFRNVIEEQEKRRRRKKSAGQEKQIASPPSGGNERQPGRILETVNSDNKNV